MSTRWTEEKKKTQSDIMKARWEVGGCGQVGGTSKPKSEAHKAALSKALKGRTQTTEQKYAIGFTVLLKHNPDCKAISYQDLLDQMSKLASQGFTVRTIADKIRVKPITAKKIMNKNQINTKEI